MIASPHLTRGHFPNSPAEVLMSVLSLLAPSSPSRRWRVAAPVLMLVSATVISACSDQPGPLEPRVMPDRPQTILVSGPGAFSDLAVGLDHNCGLRGDGVGEFFGD